MYISRLQRSAAEGGRGHAMVLSVQLLFSRCLPTWTLKNLRRPAWKRPRRQDQAAEGHNKYESLNIEQKKKKKIKHLKIFVFINTRFTNMNNAEMQSYIIKPQSFQWLKLTLTNMYEDKNEGKNNCFEVSCLKKQLNKGKSTEMIFKLKNVIFWRQIRVGVASCSDHRVGVASCKNQRVSMTFCKSKSGRVPLQRSDAGRRCMQRLRSRRGLCNVYKVCASFLRPDKRWVSVFWIGFTNLFEK